MPARSLNASEVGLPVFSAASDGVADPFRLTSHARAREALEIGLSINEPGFNIYVLGQQNSGRMTATVDFLRAAMATRPAPNDWVYLNNFRHPHRPRPVRLPAGAGRRFRDDMAQALRQIKQAIGLALAGESITREVRERSEALRTSIVGRIEALRAAMHAHGLDLVRGEDGQMSVGPRQPSDQESAQESASGQGTPAGPANGDQISTFEGQLAELGRWIAAQRIAFETWRAETTRQAADLAIGGLIADLMRRYANAGLGPWITELHMDVLDHVGLFTAVTNGDGEEGSQPAPDTPEHRYGVNLMVDQGDEAHPRVVIEANPTYENLFGRIEYRQVDGNLTTDFTMIQAGAMHRANGGVLVLRAEAIAVKPQVWDALKAALRDREIRIDEQHRAGALPVAGAPRPQPVPLELKVVLVGAPHWFYGALQQDAEFQNHFKIKADIDGEMEASADNLKVYAALIRKMAAEPDGSAIEQDAIVRLLGAASRWAENRNKLTARYEMISDLLAEAKQIAHAQKLPVVTKAAVEAALAARRRRNTRMEDRLHEQITQGTIMIDTQGTVVGQINALTISDSGDHAFGAPTRVTARASVGRLGVINIERDVELGGPIQQKGVMVLQGFLSGHFARRIPLSFNCSITFEQTYGGVEGDSASIAEILAVLSALSGAPLRQDLAVTGSVNQRGQTQAVGGVHTKIEGFFRACAEAGPLTGAQGVVLPKANVQHLVLRDDVTQAMAAGQFHLWSVATVDEAIELFTGLEAGVPDDKGDYPASSIYGRVMSELQTFDHILAERGEGAEIPDLNEA